MELLMGVAGEMSSMLVMLPRNGHSHSVSHPIQFLPYCSIRQLTSTRVQQNVTNLFPPHTPFIPRRIHSITKSLDQPSLL